MAKPSKTKTPATLRGAILAATEAQGRTQAWLCGATGLTPARVSDYLNGKRDMNGRSIEKLLAALHLRLVDCAGEAGFAQIMGELGRRLAADQEREALPPSATPATTRSRGRR